MADHEAIEGLHQRAAESYLQGDFQEALNSWRELLSLDAQDDRAIEGIRLCELLVEQSADNDLSPATEDPSVQPPPSPPAEGSDVDFDEIEAMLKEPGEAGGGDQTESDPGWDFSAIEVTGPAGDGLDLADLPSLEADPPDPSGGKPLDLPLMNLGEPAAEPEPDADTQIQSTIASLLSQASTSYDAGDLEGAMTLLDRVFVLDADNAVALALAEAFRTDIQERDEPQAGDGPVADVVADENLESLGLAAPATQTSDDAPALVPTPPELATSDDLLSALDETPLAGEVAETPAAATATPGKRKPLLIGVGVVLALAIAAFLGLRMAGSGASDSTVAPQVRPVDPAPVTEPAAEPVAEVPEITPEPVVAAPREDLPTVMARARAAFNSGEFSKAVVAYNEALQLEPANSAAKRGLSEAAAAYQEQREFTSKLNSATEAFMRSDYREALRVFYRLPGTEGVPRFDSFKANSWYNLGVGALKSGSCNDAKSHLQEAGALLPGDAGITAASKLAATCSRSQAEPVWYGEVERLSLRSLDD